jgi:hypothetical protein
MTRKTTPFKIVFVFFVTACTFIIQQAISNEAGPASGYSGAPGDNDCTSCHSGTPISSSTNIKLFTNMNGGQYIPDSTYHFTLRGLKQSCTKFGFQCAILNGSGVKLGTFIVPSSSTKVQILSGSRDYMEHTANGTTALYNDSTEWFFDWKAPSSLSGDATLFVAMNATNGDNNTTGDEVHLNQFTFPQTSNAPVASITTNVSTICQGDSVQFTGSGTNGTTAYKWSFPGGIPDTGNTQSLWVKFPAAGNEICSLRVTNPIMNSAWVTKTITVNAKPLVAIFYNSSAVLCEGDSLPLTASFNPAYSYQWKKNNTNITGATKNVLYVKSTGLYSVTVTTTQGCSVTTLPVGITVNAKPNPVLTSYNGTVACQGDTIILVSTGGNGYSYYWYKDNVLQGQTIDSFYYARSAGNWSVKVFTQVGCNAISNTIRLDFFTSPNVNILAVLDSVCVGDSINLVAVTFDTVNQYQWYSNGNILPGKSMPSIFASATGDYTVQVTSNRGCKKISPPKSIKIVQLPPPNFIDTVKTACAYNISIRNPGIFIYQWYRNDTLFNVTDTIIAATQTGNYYVRVYNSAGCYITTNTVYLNVPDAPDVNITPLNNAVICTDSTLKYSVTPVTGSTYQWYKNGSVIPGANSSSLNIKDSGNYFVKVTRGTCELQSTVRNVKVIPTPNASITSSDTAFCTGDSVMLSAASVAGLGYQWLLNGVPVSASSTASIYVKIPGNYAVKVSRGSCFSISNSVGISEHQLPAVPVITTKGDTLSSSQASTYQWLKNGAPITGATSRDYIITASGTYSVQVTGVNGCRNISQPLYMIFSGIQNAGMSGITEIYPNPVTDRLFLNMMNDGLHDFIIMDASGKVIEELSAPGNKVMIDFSSFEQGVYFVRVLAGTGDSNAILRIVKK